MPIIEDIEIYFTDDWCDMITDVFDWQIMLTFDFVLPDPFPEPDTIKRARMKHLTTVKHCQGKFRRLYPGHEPIKLRDDENARVMHFHHPDSLCAQLVTSLSDSKAAYQNQH